MPTFSEVEITFTADFVITDDLKLTTDLFSNVWTWVTTRSASNEVTTPAPGIPAGAVSAANFETAFDLDYPTGYVTTLVSNVLTIASETDGEDFLGVKLDVTSTGMVTVVFNNVVPTPTPSNTPVMLVRSPHYVNTPFDFTTTTAINLSVFIWSGDLTAVPATATEILTIQRPSVDFAEFNIDVAKIVRDKLDVEPVIDLTLSSQLVDSSVDGVKWVKYVASYVDPLETIADREGTLVAIDGYGYMQEGVNPGKPSNNVLTSSIFRKVERTGFILFPYINNGTITSIDVDSDLGTINDNLATASTNESDEYVRYVSVDVSDATTDEYITITTQPAGDIFTYEVVDECRYLPTEVVFKNRYGKYDTITMFKKRVDTLKIEKKDFKNNYISGGTYSLTRHQIKDINIVGNENVTLNSGFITQAENELYKELLLSDQVYFYENSSFVPVRVLTRALPFKTRTNDKVINYTVDFDYAFNTINNI